MRRTIALVLSVPLALTLIGGASSVPQPSADRANTDAPILPAPPADDPVGQGRMPTTPPEGPTGPDDDDAPAEAEGTVERSDATSDDDSASTSVETTFLIADVPEEGAIAGTGRRLRYTIEVEPGLGVDLELLAGEVRAALHDDRSWARVRTLEQVSDPSQASIRLVLASPGTVDELCGRADLRTAGIYSCWNGRFAALNSWRWEAGADGFDDITTYRTYLVNHEFGHGLGYGHVGCPAEGELAPVMMQQSKGHDGCAANGWPYP